MILHIDSISLQRRILGSCLLFILAALIQFTGAAAPAPALDARVASVQGAALRRNNQRAFILARGDLLNPGDEIDTRGGGRVVIELTDGSVIIVHPKSRIVIMDYRATSSMREMFRILAGRVRVKVAHYGGKPNPYRINSPTASILVRGTEFGVAVEPSGDTRVEVYDGLVEVASLSDPRRRALLTSGRGAMVKPNEDIRFFTHGARSNGGGNGGNDGSGRDGNGGNDANARTNKNADVVSNANANANAKRDDVVKGVHATGKSSARRIEDDGLPRSDMAASTGLNIRTYLARDYERYIDNLAGLGWSFPLRRFTAFADSHLDSLDNPAYAADFASIEGRGWLIPFINNSQGRHLQSDAGFPLSRNLISPFDAGLRGQGNFFIPWDRARMVIGGAVASGGARSQSLTVDPAPDFLIPLFPEGGRISRYIAISTESASITGSLLAARRFGDDGRTSVGAGVEWVSGGGASHSQNALANRTGTIAIEELKTESQINRRRFRLGAMREFDGGHKLGLLYRHESGAAGDRDHSRLFNGLPLGLDSTRLEWRSSEVSFRLRGPGARRLFYGLEGLLLWGESDGRIQGDLADHSTTQTAADSAGVGFGVGFALRRTTVLSGDISLGFSRVHEERRDDAIGDTVAARRERERYVSAHLGLQTDVWRRSFVSASAMVIGGAKTIDLSLNPDLSGSQLTTPGLAEPDGRSRQNSTNLFSDFGAGWRFSPNLVAEYIFSINRGLGPPRHVFLLRYAFKIEK